MHPSFRAEEGKERSEKGRGREERRGDGEGVGCRGDKKERMGGEGIGGEGIGGELRT